MLCAAISRAASLLFNRALYVPLRVSGAFAMPVILELFVRSFNRQVWQLPSGASV